MCESYDNDRVYLREGLSCAIRLLQILVDSEFLSRLLYIKSNHVVHG
jgi:hypothetical protein